MGHKDTFVPLDEYPEVVSKPKTKGIKGQLLNKFKNIQTRFARDQPEPILRAPLAKPEESRECSIVSGYHQIENQKQHDAKDRRSPLTKLKQKLLLKDDNLQLKVDCMRTDEQRSRFKNFQSKSMDNDSSTDDYTEIPIDMSIKSSPVVPQRLTKMDQPRHHSLSKIPGKSRVMEQKILSGSYQIRVVKRPKSLDLERRIVHSWHSQISRMTENSVQDYRDGIFEDFYDDEVEEKLLKIELPKKQEKPMTKKADRKLEDLKEEYEPDEQFVDVSIRKPEEKSIFRLNLRPLERVNYELIIQHNPVKKKHEIFNHNIIENLNNDKTYNVSNNQNCNIHNDQNYNNLDKQNALPNKPKPPPKPKILLLKKSTDACDCPEGENIIRNGRTKNIDNKQVICKDNAFVVDNAVDDINYNDDEINNEVVVITQHDDKTSQLSNLENTEDDVESKLYDCSHSQACYSNFSTRTRTNSECSSIVSALPESELEESGWIHSRPIVQTRLIKQDLNKFYPRILPYGMLLRCGKGYVNIPATEYFVIWSNGYIAIGILKELQFYEGQPVTIQLGNFYCKKAAQLYVGCTILVNRYSIVKVSGKVQKLIAPDSITFEDLADSTGIPKPQAFAIKWSCSHETAQRPPILRHLGKIVEFRYSQRHNGKGFRLFGVVVDTETNHTYFVKDDAFPGYIDEPLSINQPVVLSLAQIDFPHCRVKCEFNDLILPEWCRQLDQVLWTDQSYEFFLKIDTHYI